MLTQCLRPATGQETEGSKSGLLSLLTQSL